MPNERDPDAPPTPLIGATPVQANQPTEVRASGTEEPIGGQEDRFQQVRFDDFKRIKDKAKQKGRERGYADARAELEAAAKAAGFTSLDEALKQRTVPPATVDVTEPAKPEPVVTASTQESPAMPTNDKPKTTTSNDESARLRKQWRLEEKRRRGLQMQLDAKEAEMGLREEMYHFGVTDVDYGLRLLTRELEGKTEDEIGAFDRKAFFEGVRTARPYLFGEKVVAPTTGTNGTDATGNAPAAPQPGAVNADAAQRQQFNARTAKPDEMQARLKALGLNPHL